MIKLTEEFPFQLITQPKIIQKVFVQNRMLHHPLINKQDTLAQDPKICAHHPHHLNLTTSRSCIVAQSDNF